ncbi:MULTISPECIES: sensor histidine kinase [Bradyrhizobium]|uniref:sensor histidine kinase n=1 Tax=Bradyrhizobium TaxID=374 RepID=UPI001958C06B|nr:sensor histidine kinase [Bradyrhizobium canariense]MBM7485937.1 two-component sensor histidine kinase [Bradyrhizobium canariense]
MNALSEADQRMRDVENENDVLRDLLLKAGVEANAQVAAAKLQAVLIGELHHRVKNMLAIASAIARDASSIDAAAKTIAERMSALGVSHDLLIQESWTGAGCRTLIENAIKAFQTKGFEQFTIEGNNVAVSSGPAVALSMIIHELSTNALKYGALSVAKGRVAITWSIDAENQRFHLEWRERGGPRVVEATKKNFGSRFIQTALPGQLKGEARLLFESTGVVCDINIPLSSLQETIIAAVD